MKKKLTKEDKCALAVTAIIFLIGIISVVSCTKIEQPELEGQPTHKPVSIVILK